MKTRSEMKLFDALAICVVCFCVLGVSRVHAELYVFGQITGGQTGLNPDAFTMEVTEAGMDQTLFTFTNNCGGEGVLARIFFMENDLMAFNQILEVPAGKGWSLYEKKAMLPGGQPLGFTPHNSFGIFADPARPKNGLETGEFISILFDLVDGVSFDNIITEIDNQSLGIGIHTQSLPGGGSASFTTIPEPLSLALLGIGTILIRNKRRGTAQ